MFRIIEARIETLHSSQHDASGMVVKIRLARFGRRHAPFYNIVVAQDRTARNSKPMEVIGTYDPVPKAPLDGDGRKYKDIQLDQARAKYWLGVGAQPSDPMWRILAMAGLIEPKFRPNVAKNYRESGGAIEEPVDIAGAEEARLAEKKKAYLARRQQTLLESVGGDLVSADAEERLRSGGEELMRQTMEASAAYERRS